MWLSGISPVLVRVFAAAVVMLALAGASGGEAEAFTTTQAGYVCVDSDEASTATLFAPAFTWDEIGLTGVVVGAWNFDNATTFFGANTPPWPINFLGFAAPTPQLIVNSNGYIQWTNGSFFNDNLAQIPGTVNVPVNAICGFWDNLSPQLSPNSIRQQVLGVAPQRRLVVQWTGVPIVLGGVVTFQITVFESIIPGQPNPIRLQYLTLGGNGANGSSACVGINGLAGTGVQYLFDGQPAGNLLTPSLAVGFYPVGTAAAPWPVTPPAAAPVPAAGAGGARVDQHEDYDSTIDEFRAENCSAGAASSGAWLLIACALAMCVGALLRPRAT